MKKLLMLVHTFPPRGSVGGSVRLLKFLKYMKELRNDIQCTVITVRDDILLLHDPHLSEVSLAEIPTDTLKIIKTNTLQPRHPGHKKYSPENNPTNSGETKSKNKNSFLKNVYHTIEKFILLPDYAILWVPFSVKTALKEIRSGGADIIYATAPPFSVLVQAAVIKKLTGKKLILDIKDDWIYQPSFLSKNYLVRKFEKLLEKFCISSADKVILVTQASLDDFSLRYPELKKKFELITNGCDVSEYEDYWKNEWVRNQKFTLIHSGVVAASRNPVGFFNALAELKESGVINKNNFELKFIGALHRDILSTIARLNLEDIVFIMKPVSREDFIKLIVNADLLLAFNYQVKTVIPGKLYDYWGSRRPILLIDSPDSMAAKLLTENKLGMVKEFEDIIGIKETIYNYFNLWQNNSPNGFSDVENLYKYDRRNLTKKLIQIIDTV